MPNLPYKFTILNDKKVNPFALPGGYVYITRGLLVLAENEAEIAVYWPTKSAILHPPYGTTIFSIRG